MKTLLTFILKNKLPVLIGVLALTIVSLFSLLRASNQEKKRFEANQHALLDEVTYYKTEYGLNAASVEKLTLTNQEFKETQADLMKTIDDLNLKVRRLESITKIGTKTEYIIKTKVKDSLIYIQGIPTELKCIDINDKWLTVSGCDRNGEFDGIIQSRDSIIPILDRIPRKFIFGIKYGTKGFNFDVVSLNPYTTITYLKYIEMKRRKNRPVQ